MLEEIIIDLQHSFQATPPAVAFSRLLFAVVLGGVIGLEREVKARAAGLRTHILIAMGACLFALVAFEILHFTKLNFPENTGDPLRLISSVTSGVAFLVAGSIVFTKGRVEGLTTGAGMWMAGAIGLCCGIGQGVLALMATALVLAVLWLLSWLKPIQED